MTPMPFSDCDSMCSMSLTVVVMLRSLGATMRLAISSAEAGVLPDHADDGDVDVGKDIRRHRDDAVGANEKQEYGKDGKGIRPP